MVLECQPPVLSHPFASLCFLSRENSKTTPILETFYRGLRLSEASLLRASVFPSPPNSRPPHPYVPGIPTSLFSHYYFLLKIGFPPFSVTFLVPFFFSFAQAIVCPMIHVQLAFLSLAGLFFPDSEHFPFNFSFFAIEFPRPVCAQFPSKIFS